ncbi:tetratricopeptide repeat protein [Opitutales bacterium]|nr:tetratricopeptide repeat protein [Opitutales bacterium]
MKKIILCFLILQACNSTWSNAPSYELTQDFWNNPNFVRSFMGDYGFRTEVEPRYSKTEQTILREVIAKAENQMDEAIIYLEKKLNSESSAALDFALATMYYQRGRLTRSSESYNTAIQKFPSFLRAHKNLGFVKLGLGQYEEAASSFSKSISLGEGDGVTYVALGYCYYALEKFVSAENAYRMGILLFPESKDARNGLVNCLLETSRFPEALALLDELLSQEPENVFCHRARASALQGLGNEKDAAVALEALRRMGNLNNNDLIRLGDLYHNLNLYELSLKNYERAIADNEKLPIQKYVRVASILMNRGSYSDCFSYLEKIEATFGQSYSPQNEKDVLLLKAEVLKATGKPEESFDILKDVVAKHPLEGKALIMLGQHAWNEQDHTLAELYFERASKIEDIEVSALIEHGRMLVSIRDYEKAVRLLERAQEISPQARVARYLESIRNLLLTARIRL